jgi:topoisomerase-4 subunit B
MGKNTPDRQQHIVKNLRVEKDDAQFGASAETITEAVDEDNFAA